MKTIHLILLFAALWIGLGYYHFFYPPVVLKRTAAKVFEHIAETVETHDRAKISAALDEFLTADIKPVLDVSFFSITQQGGVRPITQNFEDKASFITFIDNVLYPLNDYGLHSVDIQTMRLNEDKSAADISFTTKQWGDGLSYYAGAGVRMRYSADGDCTGTLYFKPKVQLGNFTCRVLLRTMPRPEETHKMRDGAVLKDYLK